MKTFKELKTKAKAGLKGNWTQSVLIALFSRLVPAILMASIYVPMFIRLKSLDENNIAGMLKLYAIIWFVSIILMFITPVIHTALNKTFVNHIKYNEEISFRKFIENYESFGIAIGTGWWTALWEYLWILAYSVPAAILMVVVLVVLGVKNPEVLSAMAAGMDEDAVSNVAAASITVLLIYAVFEIYLLIVMIRIGLKYSMNYMLICDKVNLPVTETLNESKRLTKGKLWHTFCFCLSFIGWDLLTVITLGIADLWVTPYKSSALYLYYLDLCEDSAKLDTPVSSPAPQSQIPAHMKDPLSD